MKKMSQILKSFFRKQKERRERNAVSLAEEESKGTFYYDDVDDVPYICNKNVPLYRITSEPTDLVMSVVNIQDAHIVMNNLRKAYVKTKI